MAKFFDPDWEPTDEQWPHLLKEFIADVSHHDAQLRAKYGDKIHRLRDMACLEPEVIQLGIDERFGLAKLRAERVLEMLAAKGIKARIFGSLTTGAYSHGGNGGHFVLHSDVDFLIEECPRKLKYSVEADVEDIMLDIPFDVVYLDEISPHWRAKLGYANE